MNLELIISSPFRLLAYIITHGLTPWKRYRAMSTRAASKDYENLKKECPHLDHVERWTMVAEDHPELKTLDPIKWIKRFTIKRKHLETRICSILLCVWLWGYPLFLLCVGVRKLYDKF